MATKQITDLEASTGFNVGDLLLTRKTGESVDKKIDQATFIKSIGNPAVTGFTATSSEANKVVLTAANNVVIDSYYNGMIISFVSPINSTGNVTIKVGTLPFKTLQQIGSVPLTTSILKTGEYYEAVYIGNPTTGSFFQTNIIKPTIFTNEYIAQGAIAPDEQSTTYALTTAYGATKTAYYAGMSALFTVDIKSKGAVILNIDGIGNIPLQDPQGDAVPFALLPYQTVLAIYDGTVFRKHMFSLAEPEEPVDPIEPPTEIIVRVGAAAPYSTIEAAVNQLYQDYGNNNINATIQLQPGFNGGNYIHIKQTPWITIKADTAGNQFTSIKVKFPGEVNFTGRFIKAEDDNIGGFIQTETSQSQIMGKARFVNAIIERTAPTNNNPSICIYISPAAGISTDGGIEFKNVNVIGFNRLLRSDSFESSNGLFLYNGGSFQSNNSGPGANATILPAYIGVQLTNVAFNNISRNTTNAVMLINRYIIANGVTASCAINSNIAAIQSSTNEKSTLTGCTFTNTTASNFPALTTSSDVTLDGGDYRKASHSTDTPDILATAREGAIVRLKNGVLGEAQAISPGKKVNE